LTCVLVCTGAIADADSELAGHHSTQVQALDVESLASMEDGQDALGDEGPGFRCLPQNPGRTIARCQTCPPELDGLFRQLDGGQKCWCYTSAP
jgi:hypothetical protein